MSSVNSQFPPTELIIGSDHAGFLLKEAIRQYLQEKGRQVTDVGCFDENRADYPLIAEAVSRQVCIRSNSAGILVCGSGIGISIAANRFPGIRAALVHDTYTAELSRRHNNANVLCLGGRLIAPPLAIDIMEVWLKTPFEGGRHEVRLEQIDNILLKQGDIPEQCSI